MIFTVSLLISSCNFKSIWKSDLEWRCRCLKTSRGWDKSNERGEFVARIKSNDLRIIGLKCGLKRAHIYSVHKIVIRIEEIWIKLKNFAKKFSRPHRWKRENVFRGDGIITSQLVNFLEKKLTNWKIVKMALRDVWKCVVIRKKFPHPQKYNTLWWRKKLSIDKWVLKTRSIWFLGEKSTTRSRKIFIRQKEKS